MFGASLVDQGVQSSTLRSYMSAIKRILVDDGYQWDNSKLLLSTLVCGCKIVNDKVKTCLPVQVGLLDLLLFELQRIFNSQPYLEILYKTIFCTGYFGLFRIGEITESVHCMRALDVHVAGNKNKILYILRSSKMHGRNNKPQYIKISAQNEHYERNRRLHFCPFQLSQEYLAL